MIRYLSAVFLVALGSGCVGGRYAVIAPAVTQPVSASAAVYGADGEILLVPERLVFVRRFQHTLRHWSMLWTLLPLSPAEHDISPMLASELSDAKGDAIINLEIHVQQNGLANLLGVIPFVPTLATAEIVGDVVRLREPATP